MLASIKGKLAFVSIERPCFKPIGFLRGDFVDYHMVKRFKDLSNGRAKVDKVIVPNIPLFAAGSSMKGSNKISMMGFQSALKALSGGLPTFY